MRVSRRIAAVVLFATLLARAQDFTFAILGDRTGSPRSGVYEQVWREIDALAPAFAINAGDTIEGGNDATAAQEWTALAGLLHHNFPLYLTPGNHDIWSPGSEKQWRTATGRAPYYSFDYNGGAHFTILDNSRTEDLSAEQIQFLTSDLAAHKGARLKFVFFHKPFWLLPVLMQNAKFPLQKIAEQYGVTAVVSGHVHRFGYWKIGNVQYLMAGSAGGHLRAQHPEDGDIFHWTEARVRGASVSFVIHELGPPYGAGRIFPAGESKPSATTAAPKN